MSHKVFTRLDDVQIDLTSSRITWK